PVAQRNHMYAVLSHYFPDHRFQIQNVDKVGLGEQKRGINASISRHLDVPVKPIQVVVDITRRTMKATSMFAAIKWKSTSAPEDLRRKMVFLGSMPYTIACELLSTQSTNTQSPTQGRSSVL